MVLEPLSTLTVVVDTRPFSGDKSYTHTHKTGKPTRMGGLPKCHHHGCGADFRCYHGQKGS